MKTVTLHGRRKPRRPPRAYKVDCQLDWPLGMTDLPTRNRNALEEIGVMTVRDLLNTREERLYEIRMFGQHTVEHCKRIARDAIYGRLVEHHDG